MRQSNLPGRWAIATALALALLTGCASKKEPRPVRASASDVIAETGELPPQTLAPGSCGLFLWTEGEPRRFVFFAEASKDTAVMNIKGEETALRQTRAGGELFGQFMTEMTYKSDTGSVVVRVVPGDQLDGGQRIKSGRLSLISKDGWETIIPVLGLRACQTETR